MKTLGIITLSALTLVGCKDFETQQRQQAQQTAIDSIKLAMEQQKLQMERQRTIDSMKAVAAAEKANQKPVIIQNTTPSAAQTTEQRKGLSEPLTGALIGAGVGAVTGAVVDKKKAGRGALIGGASGAALGAGTGAIIQNEKKKKEK